MTISVNRNSRDLAILWRGQQSDTETRVPTAEELAATEDTLRGHLANTRRLRPDGLLNRPTFGAVGRQILIPELRLWTADHPALAVVPPHSVTVPALPAGVVNRFDHISLVVFTVEVTAVQDPAVQLTFQWRNGRVLESVTRENTARLRDVYGFWVSQGPPEAIAAELGNQLTVNKSGMSYGLSRFFPLDSMLVDGATYRIGQATTVPLVRAWRIQGQQVLGYWWGETQERALDAAIHLSPTYTFVGEGANSWGDRTLETIHRIMRGDLVQMAPAGGRGVYNLINGQVGSNADSPGVVTQSPNGSTMLANGQRVTFSNRLTGQTVYAVPLETVDDGDGRSQVTVNFAGNSPSGSAFSVSGHRVTGPDGADLSAAGTFEGGGSTGALTWTATAPGTPEIGVVVYLLPSLTYPAGSGFPVSGAVEAVYLNGAALQGANVVEADLTGYVAPGGGDNYLAVMQRSNGALRWLYRKYTANTDSEGVLRMPAMARGAIAWVNGLPGRQDKAVVTGLSANATYDFLCYYPPTAEDQWQVQLRFAPYAGTKDLAYLNGATVATEAIAFAHTLGGGTTFNPPSRPLATGELADRWITGQLPRNLGGEAVRDYSLDGAINLGGLYSRAAPFQRIPPLSAGAGLVGLRPGQVLTAQATVDAYPESLGVTLSVGGVPVGVFKPPLLVNQVSYQLVVACGVEKGGDRRVLVMTFNGGTPTVGNDLAASTATPSLAGIDVFRYW